MESILKLRAILIKDFTLGNIESFKSKVDTLLSDENIIKNIISDTVGLRNLYKTLIKLSDAEGIDEPIYTECINYLFKKLTGNDSMATPIKDIMNLYKLIDEQKLFTKEALIILETIVSYNIPFIFKEEFYDRILEIYLNDIDHIHENLPKIKEYAEILQSKS